MECNTRFFHVSGRSKTVFKGQWGRKRESGTWNKASLLSSAFLKLGFVKRSEEPCFELHAASLGREIAGSLSREWEKCVKKTPTNSKIRTSKLNKFCLEINSLGFVVAYHGVLEAPLCFLSAQIPPTPISYYLVPSALRSSEVLFSVLHLILTIHFITLKGSFWRDHADIRIFGQIGEGRIRRTRSYFFLPHCSMGPSPGGSPEYEMLTKPFHKEEAGPVKNSSSMAFVRVARGKCRVSIRKCIILLSKHREDGRFHWMLPDKMY